MQFYTQKETASLNCLLYNNGSGREDERRAGTWLAGGATIRQKSFVDGGRSAKFMGIFNK